MEISDRLWKATDVAEFLSTTPANVHLMRSRGQLPSAVKIGARLYWRPRDLHDFVEGNRERSE